MSEDSSRSSNPATPKMTLYIPESVQRLMNAEKLSSGLSLSEMVRRALVQYLDPERRIALPETTYARLKVIADRVGMSYEEFTRITIGQVIDTYTNRSDIDWVTDDASPSREAIQEWANLYYEREDEMRRAHLRRINRELILYREAEKRIRLMAESRKVKSKSEMDKESD
jgi:hypothetical protein